MLPRLYVSRPRLLGAMPTSEPRSLLKLLLLAGGGALLIVFLLGQVKRNVSDTYAVIKWDYNTTSVPLLNNNDFPSFFTGAETALSSQRGQLYDMHEMVRRIQANRGYDPAVDPPADFSPFDSKYE